MNKIKTVIKMIIISIALIYIPNVYAATQPKVYINANEKEIYETGGEGSTTFDKTTNTLTINNYTGKNISFEDFEEDAIINIIIKGTNTIDGGESNGSGYGISTDNKAILNITGIDDSKLAVNNYYNLIYIPNGTINVNNADISIKNGVYCGIYAYEGDVNIIDSKIIADNIGYPIATDGGKIYLNNLDQTATNITSTNIYATDSVTIENSNINESNSSGMIYGGNQTIIKDTNVNLNNVKHGVSSETIKIENGTFKAISNLTEDIGEIITAYNIELNSNITINYKYAEYILYAYEKLTINGGNIDIINQENIAIYTKDLEVNGGITNIQSKFFGIYTEIPESKLIFNKGEFNIKVEDGIALYTCSEEEKNIEDLIILNGTMTKDPTLNLVKSSLYGNYIYSFSKNELLPEYSNQEDLINALTKEISIIEKNIIKFDSNGGTGQMEDIYLENETILPENKFTAPQGKKFKGWSFTSDGEIISKLNANTTQTLYAIWEDKVANPETLDNITTYVIIGLISILGLAITHKKLKKVN